MLWYGDKGTVAVAENPDTDRLARAMMGNPRADRGEELYEGADESLA